MASGFNAPVDVLADERGNLIVVSYYGSLWRIRPIATVPVFGASPLAAPVILAMLLLAAATSVLVRRR